MENTMIVRLRKNRRCHRRFSMDNICKLELSNFGNIVLDIYTWINMWRANHLSPDVFNTLRKCCSQFTHFTTKGGDSYKSQHCCSFNVYFLKIICSLLLTYIWQKKKPQHITVRQKKSLSFLYHWFLLFYCDIWIPISCSKTVAILPGVRQW